jgi:hypothetical protein
MVMVQATWGKGKILSEIMHFLYKNEYGIFKPVEITLRRGLR